jgi:hypothetical protein
VPAFRGLHAVGLMAIVLGILAVRATEVYTAQYQTLPVLDWLESRPPLVESTNVPAAADLVRGLQRVLPLLVMQDDVRPLLPIFGPPGAVQRTVGGVRDAARLTLGVGDPTARPAPGTPLPLQVRLDAIVFNRQRRAVAWSDLMSSEVAMDFRDPESGLFQVRVSGPDERDGVWLTAPKENSHIATVAGYRGPVAFELQVTCERAGDGDRFDLSARAEVIARQVARDWTSWLEQQLAAA